MKNFYFLLISSLFLTSGLYAGETDYTQGLSIWFDTPNTLQGYAAWYGGRPDLWKDENKPVTAGSGIIWMPVGSHSHCLLVTVASAQILWDR